MRVQAKRSAGLGGWESAEKLLDLPKGGARVRFLQGVRSEVDVPAGRWRASKEKRGEPRGDHRQRPATPSVRQPVSAGGVGHEAPDARGGPTGLVDLDLRVPDLRRNVGVGPGLRAVTKNQPPGRDKEYLKFVRSLTCCACRRQGRMVQAHHFGERGIGQVADDYDATPCCEVCHLVWWHGKGYFEGMDRAESEAAIYKANRDALRLWIRKARGDVYVVPESA